MTIILKILRKIKTKNFISFPVVFLFMLSSCGKQSDNKLDIMPPPIDNTVVNEEMESAKEKLDKEQWIANIHGGDPSVDWLNIERQNQMDKHKRYLQQYSNGRPKDNIVDIGDGIIRAEWKEKGSNNLSGSITMMDYDSLTGELYAISAGGSLWSSPRDGSQWKLLNDDLRFDTRFLKIVYTPEGERRIITSFNGRPFYSVAGLEWQMSQGPQIVFNGSIKNVRKSSSGQYVFYLLDPGNLADIKLFYSKDYGASFEQLYSFSTSDLNNIAMDFCPQTQELMVIEQLSTSASKLYRWISGAQELSVINESSPFSFGAQGRGNIRYRNSIDGPSLFAYNGENQYYRSDDLGQSWSRLSSLPATPWQDGVFVSYADPNTMILSEVEAHISRNGGISWNKINTWPEYYDDPITKLHADMMHIDEYNYNSGSFIAIANHGGINISYDKYLNNRSIAQLNLNVSQYYSVRTYPSNPDYIFAGSQDQGIQIAMDLDEGTLNFTQLFSGDYGHICFGNLGQSMWTVYPGGWVFYFDDPIRSNFPQKSFQLESPDETVWLPPMIASPYSFNGVLLAGGQKDGFNGSHILSLEITDFGNLTVDEWPFDFTVSGGKLTGMAYNRFFSNVFYAITSNGKFYRSLDQGQSFEDMSQSLNDAQYLYGHDILSSSIDPHTLYIAGSGYSNAPVYRSQDGGESFHSIQYNLPSTTVFDLDMDSEGEFIFAATEAGPYVFVEDLEKWFDLAQGIAPNQTYWSVEYLQQENKLRFGTYGRGIWDLNILQLTQTIEEAAQAEIKTFPNPVSDILHIESSTDIKSFWILDVQGNKIMTSNSLRPPYKIDIHTIPNGVYYIIFACEQDLVTKKVIKI